MRGKIVGKKEEGAHSAQIARDLHVDVSTVKYTLRHDAVRSEGVSLKGAARPKSYTDAEERLLLRHVRANPKDTYKEVKSAYGLAFSTSTLKRILKAHGITN